jgi:hypothetical protein
VHPLHLDALATAAILGGGEEPTNRGEYGKRGGERNGNASSIYCLTPTGNQMAKCLTVRPALRLIRPPVVPMQEQPTRVRQATRCARTESGELLESV